MIITIHIDNILQAIDIVIIFMLLSLAIFYGLVRLTGWIGKKLKWW